MQATRKAGTVPVVDQIADWLRGQIISGELAPGAELPSTEELTKRWGCAPLTARQAVDVLKSEGRVTTSRGRRPVVRTPPRRIRIAMDLAQQQKDLVLRPESERAALGAIEMTVGVSIDHTKFSHKYDVIEAETELADEFGIPAGTAVQRRTYEQTDPQTGYLLSFSISYIPVAFIESNKALLDERNEPWPGGHQHQLYTVGIELEKFVRRVTAYQPTPGDRQLWGMEPGVAMLHVRSYSVDIDGRTVELSDAVYPADRTEIEFTEHLNRWPEGYPRFQQSEDK